MSTRRTINHQEAAALILDIEIRGLLHTAAADAMIAAAEFTPDRAARLRWFHFGEGLPHPPTIRRLARRLLWERRRADQADRLASAARVAAGVQRQIEHQRRWGCPTYRAMVVFHGGRIGRARLLPADGTWHRNRKIKQARTAASAAGLDPDLCERVAGGGPLS